MAASVHPARRAAAHAACLLVTLNFSVWNVLAESFNNDHASPLLLCAARDGCALVVMYAVGVARHRKVSWCIGHGSMQYKPRGFRDWLLLAAVGLTGPFLSPLATVLCIAWSSSDMAGILNSLAPAFASSLSLMLGFERMTWRLALGVGAGTAGALLVALLPVATATGANSGESRLAGFVAGLVMASTQGVFFVAMKPLLCRTDSRGPLSASSITTLAYVFAASASLATCAVAGLVSGPHLLFANWGQRETWLALYAGLICAALNYNLLTWATKYLPVTVVSFYGCLQPSMTAILAYVAKGEDLTIAGCVSAILVTCSLALLSWEPAPAPALLPSGEEQLQQGV